MNFPESIRVCSTPRVSQTLPMRFPSGAINRDETNAAPFFIFCPHYEEDFCHPRPSGRMLANKTYRDAW
jgi:hypothetical protein